jgi:DNA-binding transcriptional LysR family regulator
VGVGLSTELRHLRCFVAVADHGQVSAAAQAMHVAQPAVSQTIRQLEAELGVALFERHSRGVELTLAGSELLPHAREAVAGADRAIAVAGAHARERRRELRVGFVPPLTALATEILGAYERRQPSIKLAIRALEFADHMGSIARRDVDLALVWAGIDEPGVVLEALLVEPRAVCLHQGHPLAARAQLRFEEIEDEPLPRLPDDFPAAVSDFLHLAARRRRPARVTEELPGSFEEGIWLIASGRAICVGPLSLARALARPGIAIVPLGDVEPVTIAVARRADDNRAAVHAFGRVAREHLRAGGELRRAAAPDPSRGSPRRTGAL